MRDVEKKAAEPGADGAAKADAKSKVAEDRAKMSTVKNIGGDRRQNQGARTLSQSVANRITVKQPRRRRIVQREQREDAKGGNNLYHGKDHLAIHDVGEITEENAPADADDSHETENRRREDFAVADVDSVGDLVRDDDLIAQARQRPGDE